MINYFFIFVTFIIMGAFCMEADNDSAAGWPGTTVNGTSSGNRTQQLRREHVGPAKIVVGGSEKWRFGVNYTLWASQHEPFYVNDTLVFKYDPPSKKTFPLSVYLLPNIWSYSTCDMRRAIMIANWTQGRGRGFEYKLERWKPYYFVCGEGLGFNCRVGGMKFMVFPVRRSLHN